MPLPASAADFLALDHDQQADVVLGALASCAENERGRNLIVFASQRWFPALTGFGPQPASGFGAMQAERHAANEALEEAYAALESGGDIRPDPDSGRTFCQVTRKGHARLQATTMPNARRVTFARRALARIVHEPF